MGQARAWVGSGLKGAMVGISSDSRESSQLALKWRIVGRDELEWGEGRHLGERSQGQRIRVVVMVLVRMLSMSAPEHPTRNGLNSMDFSSHLTEQEVWREVRWLQNQLFQWFKDIGEDPGAVTFLHAGPQLACQVSLWDARPKVAAAAPSVSYEHN